MMISNVTARRPDKWGGEGESWLRPSVAIENLLASDLSSSWDPINSCEACLNEASRRPIEAGEFYQIDVAVAVLIGE